MDGMTIKGACAGSCGAAINYMVSCYPGQPEVIAPVGAIAYRGGHLCPTCASRVEWVLKRKDLAVLTYTHRQGVEVTVHATADVAFQVAAMIAEQWAPGGQKRAITNLVVAGRYRDAVALFNHHGDESLVVHLTEVPHEDESTRGA